MSYTPKKENISKMNKFIVIGIIDQELKKFHKKHINEKYAKAEEQVKEDMYKNLVENRLVFWSQQAGTEARTISQTPTRDLARTRINNLKEIKDCTPVILEAIVNYIKAEFEHIMNLGHSEAFIYLCDLQKEEKPTEPTHYKTFKYKGDLEVFYKNCLAYNVIDDKTSLDSFKMAYNGTKTNQVGIIKLTCPKTTFTSFMSLLNDAGMFEDYPKNFHKVGEAITGESDFKNALAKLRTTGTFENEKKFRQLVKTLSLNI
jgi:hypothetical protein